MAVHQVGFVHVLANLTQKALIRLPTLTFKVSVTFFYKSEKYKLSVIQITRLQWHSMEKKPTKKKSTLKVEGKKKVQQLLLGTKQNSTYRADGLFTITSVKQYTPEKNLKIILHLNVWWVICQKRNNLGLNPHLEHNAWTISTWVTHSWVRWAGFPSTTFTRQTTKW